jgi:AcrR family transcriptional regulator
MKHHMDLRERLIEAARQLFARDGFDAASVRDITARAQANLGAITYHFGTKEALYHAVIERFATPIADQIAGISAESGPPIERLAKAIRAFMDHIWRHPEMPRLILRELASDRRLPEPVARVIRRNMESFSRMVAEGQADGTIRPGEPHLMAMSIAGQPLFLALAGRAIREAIGTDPGDPAIRSLIAEHVVTNMKRALAGPGPAAAESQLQGAP